MNASLRKFALLGKRVPGAGAKSSSPYYHLSLKTYGRGKVQSAVATASYRSGEKLFEISSGTWKDCRHGRGGVLEKFIVGWTGTREGLWNAAELAETRWNARFAREIEIALPGGFSLADFRGLAFSLADWFRERFRGAVDIAIHESDEHCSNPHAHLLTTVRAVKDGRFLEKIRELDALGAGPKAVREIRAQWARVLNAFLERHGLEKVSEKSFRAQGIKRQPTIHEGHRLSPGYAERKRKNELIRERNRVAQRQEELRREEQEREEEDREWGR